MAFVAQRAGMDLIGPFLFMSLRMFLGAATLCAVVLIQGKILRNRAHGADHGEIQHLQKGESGDAACVKSNSSASLRPLLKAGLMIGLIVFVAGSLQQIGLVFTTASKAGFLTTLYIVLVPILGMSLRHKTYWNTWVSVLVAVIGLYFLSITESFSIQIGDLILLLAAIFWACHILATDHFVVGLNQRDVMKLCVIQFTVAAVLSFFCSLVFDRFFEHGQFSAADFMTVIPLVLYVGILSTGIAFTFQAIGQQVINPSAASIIMSLEAVFSVIGGTVILHETMSGREAIGCLLMFAALILSQLTAGRQKGVT